MKKAVTFNQKDSLSKKGKGGLPFESEELEDEVLRTLQSLPQVYDKAHSMHMKSCFEKIHPSQWEKYLDELHPLIVPDAAVPLPPVPLPEVPQVPLPPVPLPQVPQVPVDPVSSTTDDG